RRPRADLVVAAREDAQRRVLEPSVLPDGGLDGDPVRVRGVDENPTRLAAAVRPRPAEARRRGDDDAAASAAHDLELVPLAHGPLVDVPADDQLRPRIDEPGEAVRSPRDRPLARAPRRADELVMERDDPQGAWPRGGEPACGLGQLPVPDGAGLVAPR